MPFIPGYRPVAPGYWYGVPAESCEEGPEEDEDFIRVVRPALVGALAAALWGTEIWLGALVGALWALTRGLGSGRYRPS